MITDSAEDDPAHSDGGAPPEADGSGTSGTPVPANSPVAAPSRRAQRKQMLKEAKERLGGWSFFERHAPGEPIRVVVDGDLIGATSGDGPTLGTMILRAANLLVSLGAEAELESLAFGKSVTITFRAPDAETARAAEKLEGARQLEGAAEGAPSAEQQDEISRALREALTDVVVAAEMASELVSVPSARAPEVAVSYGSGVAEAYRTLANAVVKADVTVTIEALDREPAQLTPSKASRVAEELREATQPTEHTITAFGTLALANKEQHGFGLRLDPDARRDPVLKGKQVVHGTYRPEVEEEIIERNLWGREVRATLLVVRDALVSTSTIRPPTYTLIEVESRHD